VRSSDVKTQTGILLGSPKYMAPEQLLGRGVDHRCDIFALGVVLYEMAVGVAPFSGDDITQIMYQIVHSNPPAPSALNARLPAILDLVVARALAKDPAARYQSAAELAADLRTARVQLLAAVPPPGQEDKADEEDDASQTLPIGSLSLPPREEKTPAQALAPEQIPARSDPQPNPQTGPPPKPQRAEPGARLRISRRFDSTEAMRRLAASSGDAFERTVKLDFAALGASSEPPALGGPQPAAPPSGSSAAPPATRERGGRERFALWASVTIAALVALVIALG
jgi:serine/threonine-protein kinase